MYNFVNVEWFEPIWGSTFRHLRKRRYSTNAYCRVL